MARTLLAPAFALLLAACGSAPDGATVGVARLAVTTVPAGVACLRIEASGATRTVEARLPLAPGESADFPLDGLPTGEVIFTGDAFAESCGALTAASVRTWFAVPVTTTVALDAPAAVTLVLFR